MRMTKAGVELTLQKIHDFEKRENLEDSPEDFWYLHRDVLFLLYENSYLIIEAEDGMYQFPTDEFSHILWPGCDGSGEDCAVIFNGTDCGNCGRVV